MNSDLTRCLDDLAQRIDETEEQAIHAAWDRFLDDRIGTGFFVPPSRQKKPPRTPWPNVVINDTLHDPDLMLLQQFGFVSDALTHGGNGTLQVRCNYGVSIMSSQYGCEVVEMPREQGNTPTNHPLPDLDAIRKVVDAGVPDLRLGQGGQVFDTADYFTDVLRQWPVLDRWIELYHPDTQGPIDNAELIWGSGIFIAFFDEPELLHRFLDLMVEHYIAFLGTWLKRYPAKYRHASHWGWKHRGRIMIRDDSLMNLSPELYVDFIRDREARCLRELGGGAIHFCGRGEHVIEAMCQMEHLTAVNTSQPHLNDMSKIYAHTIDKGIQLLSLAPEACRKAGRDLRGRVHCNQQ
ncbi:MAG: hypothetical protein IT440_02985 [Phycisphaeraceae bacterium]|nr:hypothetical protein [Phycisphaeraceae bacterium]